MVFPQNLCKVYCEPAIMYGCEIWHLQNKEQNRISVASNNCFRSIFNCCWRESVNPLQYFCKVLPTNYLIHQRKHLYWNKLFTSDNSVLFTLSHFVSRRLVAIGRLYSLSTIHVNRQTIKPAVWDTFSSAIKQHHTCVTSSVSFFFSVFSGCICVYRVYSTVLLCVVAVMVQKNIKHNNFSHETKNTQYDKTFCRS